LATQGWVTLYFTGRCRDSADMSENLLSLIAQVTEAMNG
jgi:hypothetical protein